MAVEQAARVEQMRGARLLVFPELAWTHIACSHRGWPFGEVRVRRVLTLGIDREAIVSRLRCGFGSAAKSTVP